MRWAGSRSRHSPSSIEHCLLAGRCSLWLELTVKSNGAVIGFGEGWQLDGCRNSGRSEQPRGIRFLRFFTNSFGGVAIALMHRWIMRDEGYTHYRIFRVRTGPRDERNNDSNHHSNMGRNGWNRLCNICVFSFTFFFCRHNRSTATLPLFRCLRK